MTTMGYRCVNHPENQAELLITMLSDGTSVELCGACIYSWASAMAAATDPAGFAAAAEAEAAGDQAGEELAPFSEVDLSTLTDDQLAAVGLTREEAESIYLTGGFPAEPAEVEAGDQVEAEPAPQTTDAPA